MSTMRIEWACCGSVSETESWEPEECPFCAKHKLAKEIQLPQVFKVALDLTRYDAEAYDMFHYAIYADAAKAIADLEAYFGGGQRWNYGYPTMYCNLPDGGGILQISMINVRV
jgi:hypothetical protein